VGFNHIPPSPTLSLQYFRLSCTDSCWQHTIRSSASLMPAFLVHFIQFSSCIPVCTYLHTHIHTAITILLSPNRYFSTPAFPNDALLNLNHKVNQPRLPHLTASSLLNGSNEVILVQTFEQHCPSSSSSSRFRRITRLGVLGSQNAILRLPAS
jgi:hypothetical protein